ncbi:MAG: RNA-binding domain-containing protein [Thermomicrobiales bacterium]
MSRTRRGRGGRGHQTRDAQEMTWFRMDLHLHTPASADYQDLAATYLEILQKAEGRSLDIIAFTDHNSVSGIAAMRREIEDLELLEELNRLTPAEWKILEEYRRLLGKMLVLPGFEFTAAFGFHILGIFPPETTVRRLEHLLLMLNVPEDQMEMGSGQVGATADVLNAYEIIYEHGGLVIPAHVSSTHGVAMQGFRFGGQTKIAYTQSPYIHALEVTDLDDMTRRATASFFNGSKPEYPRRMHCIQGSDAHRLSREGAHRDTDLGIGDRATEVLLPERSFAALLALLVSEDFVRIRPYQPVTATPYDAVQAAREQGPSIVQSFHEQVRSRRSRYRPILKDVVAFANTNGGTIYVGMTASPTQPVVGVPTPEDSARGLRDALARSVVPKLDVTVDVEASGGKQILIVTIPKGLNTPYATDAGQVFVRQESETVIALRDEIVQLVREAAAADTLPAVDLTRERAWTAPRQAPDEDDESDDVQTADSQAADSADAPTEEAPSALRSERRPRRRRPPARKPTESEETHTAVPVEPLTAEEVHPVYDLEPPAEGAEAASPIEIALPAPASDVVIEATAPVALPVAAEPPAAAEPVSAPEASGEPPATEAPKPRPRRRTRRPAKAEATLEVATPPTAALTPEEQAIPVGASTPAVSRNGSEPAVIPKAGVEILSVEERDGEQFYTMRDLRSGRVAENITRKSARRLWRQAIMERESGVPEPGSITWEGDLGYVGSAVRDGVRRYNLAFRENGDIRYFYAVGDEGINEAWRHLVAADS